MPFFNSIFFWNVKYIEFLIAITQFAAVFFNISTGIMDVHNGNNDYYKMKSLLRSTEKLLLSSSTNTFDCKHLFILNAVLKRDMKKSSNRIIVGLLQIIIGSSFMFLFLNSLHLVEIKSVIDSLICQVTL